MRTLIIGSSAWLCTASTSKASASLAIYCTGAYIELSTLGLQRAVCTYMYDYKRMINITTTTHENGTALKVSHHKHRKTYIRLVTSLHLCVLYFTILLLNLLPVPVHCKSNAH